MEWSEIQTCCEFVWIFSFGLQFYIVSFYINKKLIAVHKRSTKSGQSVICYTLILYTVLGSSSRVCQVLLASIGWWSPASSLWVWFRFIQTSFCLMVVLLKLGPVQLRFTETRLLLTSYFIPAFVTFQNDRTAMIYDIQFKKGIQSFQVFVLFCIILTNIITDSNRVDLYCRLIKCKLNGVELWLFRKSFKSRRESKVRQHSEFYVISRI